MFAGYTLLQKKVKRFEKRALKRIFTRAEREVKGREINF
jgi:hypothetical protein